MKTSVIEHSIFRLWGTMPINGIYRRPPQALQRKYNHGALVRPRRDPSPSTIRQSWWPPYISSSPLNIEASGCPNSHPAENRPNLPGAAALSFMSPVRSRHLIEIKELPLDRSIV